MKHSLLLALILVNLMPLNAQDNQEPVNQERPQQRIREHRNNGIPGLGRNALLININASVKDENKIVIWNQTESKTTIPGRPVNINLVGSNVVVAVQITPFIRKGTSVLVAQNQIWIEDPEKGVGYYTSIKTIPMEFGEPIHYLPLGSSSQSNSYIEIIITTNPYNAVNNEQ